MNDKEISEIRRRYRAEKSGISRIRGCYVNEKRTIISEFDQSLGLMSESEAEEVLSLYRSLVGTPFCAWTADYPARSDVEFDLSRNALFCLRDEETGEIAGVISIDQDPKVESLTCWTPELQPGRELSRLGVREAYQNQGIARRLMAGAMEELRRQGFKSVHILVAKENKKALASYKIFEYETVGACFLHEHDYWCYEKAL